MTKHFSKSSFFNILVVGLALAGPAVADIKTAKELMQSGKFSEAREELWPAARAGNADAEDLIAVTYALGLGAPQDNLRAFDWYLRSAMKGHSGAQSSVGWYFETGRGLPAPDPVRAYVWYALSAVGKEPDAELNRDAIAQKLSPEELARGDALIQDYTEWLYPF